MKKTIAVLLLICSLCLLFSACIIEQRPFIHSLKTGRYICNEEFNVGDFKITFLQIELTEGDRMRYVKPAGKSMIKDLSTVNEKFYTVMDGKISMCINGETTEFRFEKAEALNRKTETEYKVYGLYPDGDASKTEYSSLKDFVITTVDGNGDGVAEKLQIAFKDATAVLENTDIPYRFTLHDENGVFGTKGTVETTYFDYQTVRLNDYDVVSYTYDGSRESKYRMPMITLSTGEVLKPVLIKAGSGSSIDYWLFEFPMPSQDLSAEVSQIEVDVSDFN